MVGNWGPVSYAALCVAVPRRAWRTAALLRASGPPPRGNTHVARPPMPIPSLTFRSITARPVVLKLKRPVVARIATITDWPLILIDLATDEGVVGRAYLEPYIVKSMRYLVPALHDLGTALKGRPVAPFE